MNAGETGSELIDLTHNVPAPGAFSTTDAILLVTTGGVGYLAKKAFEQFFPGTPSVKEQIDSLGKLIEVAGRAGAKSLKVRMSAGAEIGLAFPGIKESKVLARSRSTVDLEILFYRPRRRTD